MPREALLSLLRHVPEASVLSLSCVLFWCDSMNWAVVFKTKTQTFDLLVKTQEPDTVVVKACELKAEKAPS